MSGLQTPIKHVLRDATTPESVARMWSHVESRGRAATPRPAPRRLVLAVAASLAFGVVLLFLYRAAPRAAMPGPVLEASGAPFEGVHVRSGAGVIALNDGSEIALADRAHLEVLDNSGTEVVLLQRDAAVEYEVHPGGPRRWTIECGLATVEVIGTHFRIARSDLHVRVEVTRGKVLVRGDRVPDRVVQLTAGQSIEVDAAPPPVPASAEPAPAPAHSASDPAPPREPTPIRADHPGWRELAAEAHYDEAYATLGAAGISRLSHDASVEDLLALADIARLSRHPQEALVPLERVVSEHEDDPHASLAAFTLGRVQLDGLHAPAAAALAFEKAILLGVPGGLAEDAYAHLVEARSKAGDADGAKAAYLEYKKRFPSGSQEPSVRRWVSDDSPR